MDSTPSPPQTISLPIIQRSRPIWPRIVFGSFVFTMLLSLLAHFARTTIIVPGPRPQLRADRLDAPIVELSHTPAVLIDPNVASTQVTLHGVRLGDPRRRIAAHLLTDGPPPREMGLIQCRDGNEFYCPGGKVMRIVIGDRQLLDQLQNDIAIRTQLDLILRFGSPSVQSYSNSPGGHYTVHNYPSRGLAVRWDEYRDRIDQISLTPPTSIISRR